MIPHICFWRSPPVSWAIWTTVSSAMLSSPWSTHCGQSLALCSSSRVDNVLWLVHRRPLAGVNSEVLDLESASTLLNSVQPSPCCRSVQGGNDVMFVSPYNTFLFYFIYLFSKCQRILCEGKHAVTASASLTVSIVCLSGFSLTVVIQCSSVRHTCEGYLCIMVR